MAARLQPPANHGRPAIAFRGGKEPRNQRSAWFIAQIAFRASMSHFRGIWPLSANWMLPATPVANIRCPLRPGTISLERRTCPRQQLAPGHRRQSHRSHSRGAAKAARAVAPRNGAGRNPRSRRDRADHRQNRSGRVRDARGSEEMARSEGSCISTRDRLKPSRLAGKFILCPKALDSSGAL